MRWNLVKLSEVCEIIAGQSPESKYYNTEGIGMPFFQGKTDFGYDYPKVRYYCTKPTKIANPNDILLSVRAPVGPTNICNVESCIGRGLAAIRCSKKVNFKYIYYWFKSNELRISNMGNGSTFLAITTKVVKELFVPLPPLHIQERIADTLDKAEALRRKDQELLVKYDQLTQAIFYEMFGDPMKNEHGWDQTKIKQVTSLINGDRSSEYPTVGETVESGIPFFSVNDVVDGELSDSKIRFITNKKFSALTQGKLEKGDLIITLRGSGSGTVYMFNSQKYTTGFINAQMMIIRASEVLRPRFLLGQLMSQGKQNDIKRIRGGSAIPQIPGKQVGELLIIVPPIELQKKYELLIALIKDGKIKIPIPKSDILFKELSQKIS